VNDVVADALCFRLSDEADRTRWRIDDIPWSRLDRARVTPELVALVRAIAFSELTTATATRRFLTELGDDVDFTQWVSVWFYEETRHPQVFLRWLHEVGVSVDDDFVRRGRATAPFMKSRIGTLVTNIISEMIAAASYARLHARSPEPVLAAIARCLAADEARHAASFYAYARRCLERSRDADADCRDALKVLYVWFRDNDAAAHPVNEFLSRNAEVMSELHLDGAIPRDRIRELIGTLVDLPLAGDADVAAAIHDLGRKRANDEAS
jgi:hypothetical protein